MAYTILPTNLHSVADAANRIMRARYGLPDGIVEQEIAPDIPIRPTLHWKTKTHIIACEVAERPFPTAIKISFADIVGKGQPIRLLVAYPSTHGLSHDDFRRDTKQNQSFGIGHIEVNEDGSGQIEYQGISLPLHMAPIDPKIYVPKIRPIVQDAFEQYMQGGNPRGALQDIGQSVESILYNVARDAKRTGKFGYAGFNPPNFIAQSVLIREMINEQVIEIPILGRCRDFADDRNAVSHKPKSRKEANEVERRLKENFVIGMRILEDLPEKIKSEGYTLKI